MEKQVTKTQPDHSITLQVSLVQCIQKYNEGEKTTGLIKLLDCSRHVNMTRVVSKETLSFNQLTKVHQVGYTDILMLIVGYMRIIINESFNLVKSVTDTQLIMFAEDIIKEGILSIEDVIVFMDMFRKGQLGKIYNRIDIDVIYEFYGNYIEERMDAYDKARKAEYQPDQSFERVCNVPGNYNYDKHIAEFKKSGKQANDQRIENFKESFL